MNRRLTEYTEVILQQLSSAIVLLSDEEYQQSLVSLSGATIGQHVRHIVEFYQCLLHCSESGIVDYDKRKRNKLMEESAEYAITTINMVTNSFGTVSLKKEILLNVCYDQNDETFSVISSLERELVYNIEHTVHHMAIIKIGFKELKPEHLLPSDFGVAMSTIKHREHVHSHVFTEK